ncbi:DNA mismatch repair protein Mlh1 [Smittium culicis]|uniref:DNA mismatch repair protein Mlh1 n=2 Tax=Smittium culicis TaxID=133412 RepID=A0A1R1YBZ0_9FUNG|nr:DNA mismatch repair protein Mlh1 [Smittium culicis]
MKILQIQDNGIGIHKDDLELLCERFTTSKIQNYEDLETIQTYGFRGEALASISHVSHLTVVTKTKDSVCAYRAKYSDGKLVGSKPGESSDPKQCAANDGTQIIVEDLFYNIPYRKHALKKVSEEYSRILDVVGKYAVHNAGIAMSCRKIAAKAVGSDLQTSTGATKLEIIQQVYGRSVSSNLFEFSKDISNSSLGVKIYGYASGGNIDQRRTNLLLFINNRLVENSQIKSSIEQLYSMTLPRSPKPFVYLSLYIKPQHVDVNVHPTKKEVHFLNQDSIIIEIVNCIQEILLKNNDAQVLSLQDNNKHSLSHTGTFVEPGMVNKNLNANFTDFVSPNTPTKSYTRKVPEHKLVRMDSKNVSIRSFMFMDSPEKQGLNDLNSSGQKTGSGNGVFGSPLGLKNSSNSRSRYSEFVSGDVGIQDYTNLLPGPNTNKDSDGGEIHLSPSSKSKRIKSSTLGLLERFENLDSSRNTISNSNKSASLQRDNFNSDGLLNSNDNRMTSVTHHEDGNSKNNGSLNAMDIDGRSEVISFVSTDRSDGLNLKQVKGSDENSENINQDKNISYRVEESLDRSSTLSQLSANSAEDLKVAQSKDKSSIRPRVEVRLSSVLELRQELVDESNKELTMILRDHTLVGLVDTERALVQYSTKLFMINYSKVSECLFYQMVLMDFCNFGKIELNPVPKITDLILLALTAEVEYSERLESYISESRDMSHEEKVSYLEARVVPKEYRGENMVNVAEGIFELIFSRKEMLEEYFCMSISEDGGLVSIPMLMRDYIPNLNKLPLFLLRIGTELNWESEKMFFKGFSRELARFYSCEPPAISTKGEKNVEVPDDTNDTLGSCLGEGSTLMEDTSTGTSNLDFYGTGAEENGSKEEHISDIQSKSVEMVQYCHNIEFRIFPALKSGFDAPESLVTDNAVFQLANLPDLYKIFERC